MAENEINSILEYKKTTDELRWFSSAEEFLTVRDDITLSTVQTMVDAVKDAYDFSRDFYKFKADLFWVKSFSYSEKNLNYGSFEKQYSFDEAVKLCQETLWKWDSELLDIFNKSLEDWMIDVFPQKWKRWWWFCTDSSKWLPVYILMNYTNQLRDVSTLIHESWHNACNQLQKKNLNALEYWAAVSLGETPSTFYESLLQDSLQSTLTDEELLVYRVMVLDDIVATVPRQVAWYRFEQEWHKLFREKWYLWADELWEVFIRHMKDYTWEWIHYDDYDKNRRISWHHSRLFFYVYSYASGYLISQVMLRRLKNWTLTIDQIKSFFASWSSKSPEEIFMDMWIDITKREFRDEWLNSLKEYLNETKQLAERLWKIKNNI
jgi:oligoendopeptidase F